MLCASDVICTTVHTCHVGRLSDASHKTDSAGSWLYWSSPSHACLMANGDACPEYARGLNSIMLCSGLDNACHDCGGCAVSTPLTARVYVTVRIRRFYLAAGAGVGSADAATGSTQLSVLSRMNEQLASENAALITELATVQRRLTRQAIQEGRQKDVPTLVSGVPAKTLESFLSPPGTAAAAAADKPSSAASPVGQMSSQSMGGCDEEVEQDLGLDKVAEGCSSISSTAWADIHSGLHQRTQQLDAQIELTQLRSEIESLKAEAAEAAARDLTTQGLVHTLQRQLRDADSQHQQEIKELKKAGKQIEKRAEQLAQQLPKKAEDSSMQVCL